MKIGFFGGTFDPPHLGHTGAALTAAVKLDLDLLLLIPTATPPHKKLPEDTAGSLHRFEMAKLAAEELDGIKAEASDIELKRGGSSYTADTVEELSRLYPGSELWLICGEDMLLSLPEWYRGEWLAENLNIAAFARSEDESELLEFIRTNEGFFKKRIELIKKEPVIISSTELRFMLKQGRGARWLSQSVYAYILSNRLYGVKPEPEALWELIKPWMKKKRLDHVQGCRSEAVNLALQWGADVTDAENAAILHDITKKYDRAGQLLLCEKYDITVNNSDLEHENIIHAITGAELAYKLFGVSEEVRDAIRWHSTGRVNMSLLEKIIYLADFIEPDRDFDGVEELRRAAYTDLDEALIKSFEMSLEYLNKKGIVPQGDTAEALKYLRKNKDI
jgi:nicotinate-nucleotide adenylyltransferase